ncbi:MAG TPA: PD-(D/E)XK nuclease family protein, partial [Chthoniobacterales bacterium]|nr:PD-(D/E)XK nuclease family protein [Chthoniobacterales bacterium]
MKQKVALRIASSPQDAWSGAIAPWFRKVLPNSWKEELPTIVLVPTRAHMHWLKGRLLAEGQSHLGIQFVTAAGLRELLSDQRVHGLARREHVRLLLAVAAEQENDGDNLAAKAVVRAPDHLLRTLERLENAGWDFDRLGLDSFQPIVRRFGDQLRACDFSMTGAHDRELLSRAKSSPPRFGNLLVSGFDSAHWPHWFLLRAAIHSAENATVLVEYPRENSAIDQCWIGSWEELLGEAIPVNSPIAPSADSLFTEAEMRGEPGTATDFTFAVAEDASQQAEAIALLCSRFLVDTECTRVGIIFSGAGSLPRLVANELANLEIPHNDGFGHPVPGLFEAAEWRAWLQLQRGPRLNSLVRFLGALQTRPTLFPELRCDRFEKTLRSINAQILIDDLALVELYCRAHPQPDRQEVANVLALIQFLPARATFAEFLAATEEAFARLQWKHHWSALAHQSLEWATSVPSQFSRVLFLRWLEEIASSFSAGRDEAGDHPYARVQLLTVAQAQGQDWSHLIFAGWNEGSWPPPEKAEFAREEEIEEFNRGIQQLNRRATAQGRQGEGHIAVRDNHALYLGPREQRQIALRQFQTLVESAAGGIAISASLVQETAPDRPWNPSELFTQLYQNARRRPLTQVTLKELQRHTAAWLSEGRASAGPKHSAAPREIGNAQKRVPPKKDEGVLQTRIAYDARRDPEAKSGEYDFALREPLGRDPILSVSEFETVLKSPALVWMKKFLGVEGAEDETNPWSAATGQWVHRWLSGIAGAGVEKVFARIPDADGIDQAIRAAAEEKYAELKALSEAARRPLPEWWRSGWQNAFCLARILGAKLATIGDWPWMAAEWTIDGAEPIRIDAENVLMFRGRIDLVLARQEIRGLDADELWILDYKTGANKKALAPAREDTEKRRSQLHKKILDGSAVQLALYGLAARQLGTRQIFLSLVSPAIKPVAPQLSVEQMDGEADAFRELARIQRTGIFGMLGPVRSA